MDILNEVHQAQVKLMQRLNSIPMDQMIIAKRAKMTLCEMLKCIELSEYHSIALEFVMKEMESFKQTSAHLLYKEEFSLAV